MITTKKLIILDMDGTLFDSSERFNQCQKISGGNKRAFWDCFLSPDLMYLDTPIQNVVEYVKSIITENDRVVVISGRTERQLEKSKEQLEKIGIYPDEIFVRKPGDFRKDHEYKASVLEQLLKENYTEVIIIDDSQSVLDFVPKYIEEKFGIKVTVIDAKKLY